MSASLSLATRALRGFLWNGSASVIQLGVMLALYKLLPLEKLGHFEWALALVMLLSLVGDLGLGRGLGPATGRETKNTSTQPSGLV